MAEEYKSLMDLGGLKTDSPSDKIPDRNSSDCQNIDYSSNGLIQTRLGYRQFANRIEDEGKCLNAFLFRKNFGTVQNIHMRVRSSSTESILEYLSQPTEDNPDGVYQTLLDGLEPLAPMGFAIANGDGASKVNRLVMGNAYDDMLLWNGALATVASATSNSIVCNELLLPEGFETEYRMKLMINGVEYTYTGITNYTFTGVTPNPSAALTAGDSVAQSIDTERLVEHIITGDTFTFSTGATNSTIVDSASGFVTAGFTAGQKIVIGGSVDNDGIYTIKTVTDDTITLSDSDYLEDEVDGTNITISAGVPKGNTLLTAQRKLWVAGNLDNFSKVHYSQSGDVTCFGITSGLGSGGTFDLIEGSGKINLLEARGKNTVIIHKDDAIIAYTREALDATNVSESFDTIGEGTGVGATSPKARVGYNSTSYFMTGVEGVKTLDRVINEDLLEVNSITNSIFPTLKNFDNSNASMAYYASKRLLLVATDNDVGDRVVISIYIKGDKSTGFSYDISIDDIPAEDFLVDGDDLYFVSSLDQNTYLMFARNSDNLVQANHYWTSKDFTFNEPARGKQFNKIYVEGFIKEGTVINIIVYYGIAGNRGIKNHIIRWDDVRNVSFASLGALGETVIGRYSLGYSNTDLVNSRYFGIPIHFDVNKSTRFKIKIETLYEESEDYDKETYWAVSNISLNPDLDTIMYNEIENSNDESSRTASTEAIVTEAEEFIMTEDGDFIVNN